MMLPPFRHFMICFDAAAMMMLLCHVRYHAIERHCHEFFFATIDFYYADAAAFFDVLRFLLPAIFSRRRFSLLYFATPVSSRPRCRHTLLTR